MLAFTPIVPNIVFVAKPSEMSYADAMLALRTWLDHQKIQPAGFKIVNGGRIGFELIFSTERDALAFKHFEWHPSEVEQLLIHYPPTRGERAL